MKLTPEECYRVYLGHKKMFKPNVAGLKASSECGFGSDVKKFWVYVKSNQKEGLK